MNKILTVEFSLSVEVDPVLNWSIVVFSFAKKDKSSQGETIQQVKNSDNSTF